MSRSIPHGANPFRTALPTRSWRGAAAGLTLLETAVAGAIATVVLTSLFMLNTDMMHMLRSSAEATNASAHLQTRVEQVRLANWNQLSDPTWVQANLLNNATDADINLPGLSETVTVSGYQSPCSPAPTATPPPPFTVARDATGKVTTSPSAYAYTAKLAQQEMLQIDLSVTWPSLARTRSRTQTTVVSPWGISK